MYLLKAYEGLYKIHGKVCPKSGTHEPPCTLDSRNFRSQARGERLPKQAIAYAKDIIAKSACCILAVDAPEDRITAFGKAYHRGVN